MAVPAEYVQRPFTYADLEALPEDMVIRSIIDGELFVTPSPITRHQDASGNLHFLLKVYANDTGGKVYAAPYGVYYTDENFVEPDVIFIRADHLDKIGPKHVNGAPDLVIEISSPSTRKLDVGRKRGLYERFGVPEFWFVDLEAERVEVYLLSEGVFLPPLLRYRDQFLQPSGLPELSVSVVEALGG